MRGGRTDIREYIEKETGIKTIDVGFENLPELPFIIIFDETQEDGDDFKQHVILKHNLTVEFYSGKINKKEENQIEAAFAKQKWKIGKERTWFWKEKIFETIYTTNFTEKR